MALVSYDQMQFSGATKFSLAYLTIVGAYLIEGERNDTRTMIDAAVYDVASRKLLFRAPGLSQIKGSAAPVNVAEELKADREKGFSRASTNLAANLEVQLAEFRQRITNAPNEVKIVRSPGYTGGGALGIPEAVAALTLVLAGFCGRRR
jgi:rhombotail lipoprotein